MHAFCVVEQSLCPGKNDLSLIGKSQKPITAIDDRRAHLPFKIANTRRKRRLRNPAILSGPGKMLMATQSRQQFHVSQINHRRRVFLIVPLPWYSTDFLAKSIFGETAGQARPDNAFEPIFWRAFLKINSQALQLSFVYVSIRKI
jgi:hypothetical protein